MRQGRWALEETCSVWGSDCTHRSTEKKKHNEGRAAARSRAQDRRCSRPPHFETNRCREGPARLTTYGLTSVLLEIRSTMRTRRDPPDDFNEFLHQNEVILSLGAKIAQSWKQRGQHLEPTQEETRCSSVGLLSRWYHECAHHHLKWVTAVALARVTLDSWIRTI